MAEASTRPYLIRALQQWALDNGFTPQLAVDVTAAGVRVPDGYARDGQIVLNIHPQAAHQLELGNDTISFFARFGGKSEPVVVPVQAVLAIFARENGRGIQFPAEAGGAEPPPAASPEPDSSAPRKGAHLKVIK